MRKLSIIFLVIICAAALPAHVAVADSLSVVRIADPDGSQLQDESQPGLSSYAINTTPYGNGEASTFPGGVGMRVAFPSHGFGGYAETRIRDNWVGTYTGSGTAPDTVPITLHVKFEGTLDPLFLNPAPAEPVDMKVHFTLSGYSSEFSSFEFLARYDNGTRFLQARFGDTHEGNFEDVTEYILRDPANPNHISFDRQFTLNVSSGRYSERFNGIIAASALSASFQVSVGSDFFNTFAATLTSNDPNVTFTSEGGRTTLPEPVGLGMMAAVMAGLRARRRR